MKNLINTIANAVFTGKTKNEKVIKPKRKSPVKRGKLTATQKAEIIEEYAKKSITQSKLAEKYNVSISAVWVVIHDYKPQKKVK
jgi:hypothetical protein